MWKYEGRTCLGTGRLESDNRNGVGALVFSLVTVRKGDNGESVSYLAEL